MLNTQDVRIEKNVLLTLGFLSNSIKFKSEIWCDGSGLKYLPTQNGQNNFGWITKGDDDVRVSNFSLLQTILNHANLKTTNYVIIV